MDRHRPDACRNGVADQPHSPPTAATEALRTAGTAVGTFLYGVGTTQGLARSPGDGALNSRPKCDQPPRETLTGRSTQHAKCRRGDFLSVPCTFPDLRDDRHLKGAIRFAIEKQRRSLETQHEQGAFIHRLIALAESLLRKVDAVPSRRPQKSDAQTWLRRPMRTDSLRRGPPGN